MCISVCTSVGDVHSLTSFTLPARDGVGIADGENETCTLECVRLGRGGLVTAMYRSMAVEV